MRYVKWLTSFLLLVVSIFVLTACGEITEKPTGLEDAQGEQTTESADAPYNKVDENVEKAEGKENQKDSENNTEDEVKKDEKQQNSSNEDEQEKSNSTNTNDSQSTSSETGKTIDNKQEKSSTNTKSKEKKKSSTDKKSSNKEDKASQSERKDTNKKKETASDTNSSNPETENKSKIVYSIVISSSEVPLSPTEMEIKDGDTVLDALIDITMEKEVHMDYRGGQGATAYVQGMGNVYEFDRGSGSGWMYRVNGIFPDRGAGVVPLMDGDVVEWLYTTNLGEDLNADLKPFRR